MRDTQKKNLAVASSQFSQYGEYWLNQLSGNLLKAEFPCDFEEKKPVNTSMEVVKAQIREEMFTRLMKLRNGSDPRLHMVFVAAITFMLSLYQLQEDILLGMPIYKQEVEGDFINTYLPLRHSVNRSMTFKKLLLQVRETITNAVENQNYPIEVLLDQLGIPFTPGDNFPLSDVAVLLVNIQDETFLKDKNHSVVIRINRCNEHMELEWKYNSQKYRKETMEAFVSQFSTLLLKLLFELDAPFSEMDLISTKEKEQILSQFNHTALEYPIEKTIHRLFEEQVNREDTDVAAGYEDNFLSYQQLNASSNQLAELLREEGIGPEVVIALILERSVEMMVAILGTLKSGGAYLPIDSTYPQNRIQQILEDSSSPLLLVQQKLSQNFDIEKLKPIKILFLEDLSERLNTYSPFNSESHNTSRDLFYLLYTSGSTGTPKGVMVEHRSIVNLVVGLGERIFKRYEGRLRIALLAPYVFDPSVQQMFASLILGHCLYIVPEEKRTNGAELLDFYIKYGVDVSDGTPVHIGLMNREFEVMGYAPKLPVKHFIIGGEALLPRLVRRFTAAFKTKPPEITNAYGTTESAVDSVLYDVSEIGEDYPAHIPIGKPMPNVKVYILDENKHLLPVLVPGELCIGGDGVSRGYLKRDDLTQDRFIEDPFCPGERLYRTGDTARWLVDGNLEFLGRRDHQVSIRGYRVELGEIETHLLTFSDISDAVVTLKEDKEGEKSLCAYMVPKQDSKGMIDIDPITIRAHLSQQLPNYMVPQYFIQLEQMPLKPNGKVDREALPEPRVTVLGDDYVAPKNRIEEKLVKIWSEVLKIEVEKISIHADFFTLGGHSLKAAIMLSKIHMEFDVKVPLAEIFTASTVGELAEYIKKSEGDTYIAIKPAQHKECYPLASAQKRLYFFQQLDPKSILYNIPLLIELEEKPQLEKIQEVFRKLIVGHESLRTTFELRDGEPVQRIHEDFDFSIDYVETSEEQATKLIRDLLTPFDLSQPLLIKAAVVKVEQEHYYLVLNLHHIIVDGVSIHILRKDFKALYNNKELPQLNLQFKDFAEWQNALLQSPEIRKQEQYWKQEFQGTIPVLNLPWDYPRPALQSFEGGFIRFETDRQLTRDIRRFTQETGTTLFMFLIAAYVVLLYKYSGQEDMVVGIPMAGRNHPDLQQIIGMFVNMLALRQYPKGSITFMQFLKQVKEHSLEAFINQDYPFEMVIDTLQYQRDVSRSALFDASFWLQNMGEDPLANSGEAEQTEAEEGKIGFNYCVSRFDISLICFETSDRLLFSVEYSTNLFKKETIKRLTGHYLNILNQVLEEPGLKLQDITTLSQGEKEQMLLESPATEDKDKYDFV